MRTWSASPILAAALVVFLGIVSALLAGAALADGTGRKVPRERWRVRAELVIGVLGFAFALWAALGLLTHAR